MKQDIISITLTEISLVLLFVILIISYSDSLFSKHHQHSETEHASLRAALNDKENELRRLRELMTIQKKQIEKQKYKSNQRPSCTAKKVAGGFLGTITILKNRKYRTDDFEFTAAGIEEYYKADLALARKNGCVQSVKVLHSKGVSLSDYLDALKKLERWFYIKKING